MAIKIVEVERFLAEKSGNHTLVPLHVLSKVREPYRAILLQPEGRIEANENRVGHADAAKGAALCAGFLRTAADTYADLAVAPEYCVPWYVVEEIISGTYRPAPGAIWVLGCESISPADLKKIAESCVDQNCQVLHEDIDPRQAAQKQYLDPLLYVFWTRNEKSEMLLTLLVQFKTVACRDYRDVEQTSLCVGTNVYVFNRGVGQISLLTIICSDAFDFVPYVDDYHINCLLIHIQLNPKPAHADYARYRNRLCSVGSNSHAELLCLNWAENIHELKGEGKYVSWENVAGSAWYAPPAKFGSDDKVIEDLHSKGLYYSLLNDRWHSFFLNYEPHILMLQKQKLLFPGEQGLVPKSFVSVIDRWSWNLEQSVWRPGQVANDGFGVAVAAYNAVSEYLVRDCKTSPLAVERAIEVLAGVQGEPTRWYEVQQLSSFKLDLNEESIKRVTVHQERETTRPGVIYRKQRLQRAQDAATLTQAQVPWPASVRDLADGFQFAWQRKIPYHNVVPNTADRRSASLVYLGDEADDEVVESAIKKITQAAVTHATKEAFDRDATSEELSDAIVRAQDRLCIVFRRGQAYGTRGFKGINYIDVPAGASAVDITQG